MAVGRRQSYRSSNNSTGLIGSGGWLKLMVGSHHLIVDITVSGRWGDSCVNITSNGRWGESCNYRLAGRRC